MLLWREQQLLAAAMTLFGGLLAIAFRVFFVTAGRIGVSRAGLVAVYVTALLTCTDLLALLGAVLVAVAVVMPFLVLWAVLVLWANRR
ncbi:unnamed protein product [Schistocephalus solidus]|uniref:Permease n=1 Tax=Schistocephalus solidus TaxID=70667 RepID=A0A183SIN4_SCHSO|nr:unnamed protein product [Schistocephalus solidus]